MYHWFENLISFGWPAVVSFSFFQLEFCIATFGEITRRRKEDRKATTKWRRHAFWMIRTCKELVEFFGCVFLDVGDGLHSKRQTENGWTLAFISKQNNDKKYYCTFLREHQHTKCMQQFWGVWPTDTGEKSTGKKTMVNWCVYIRTGPPQRHSLGVFCRYVCVFCWKLFTLIELPARSKDPIEFLPSCFSFEAISLCFCVLINAIIYTAEVIGDGIND